MKRGDMTAEEIGKIAIAVLILAFLIFLASYLLKTNGSQILEAIRNLMRFGKS